MNRAHLPATDAQASATHDAAVPFVSYTHFPKAEAFLEQHLGQTAKFLLPAPWVSHFVRHIPWIAAALLVIKLYTLLTVLQLTSLGFLRGFSLAVSLMLAMASFACDAIALPGLFKRTRRGWTFFLDATGVVALSGAYDGSLGQILICAVVL